MYKHSVQFYETDKMGITHHSNYPRFMEEARIAFLKDIGWGYDKLESKGLSSPVTKISVDYKKSTTFADLIEIEIFVLDISPVRLTFKYIMKVGEVVVATAESEHCFLDNGKILNLKKGYPELYTALSNLKREF